MKVLLWMIDDNDVPGGHRVQIDQTARSLRKLNVVVDVSYDKDFDINSFDLIHGFNLSPFCLRKCRQAGIPVVLSTIYWPISYMMGQDKNRMTPAEYLIQAVSLFRQSAGIFRSTMQKRGGDACLKKVDSVILCRLRYEMADLILPNSELEAQCIISDLNTTTSYRVVPNAVDDSSFSLSNDTENRKYVLYAGRIEPHKNQLGLIRSWDENLPHLKIIGKAHPHHGAYYKKCQIEATKKGIDFLEGVPHDKLSALYNGAKVHVLPSWFETTGLVSLEAALCGCNIVTTNRGFAKEYFQDFAWYCDPSDPASIRKAVKSAFSSPFQSDLRQRILDNYTWGKTAIDTLEAYKIVLS